MDESLLCDPSWMTSRKCNFLFFLIFIDFTQTKCVNTRLTHSVAFNYDVASVRYSFPTVVLLRQTVSTTSQLSFATKERKKGNTGWRAFATYTSARYPGPVVLRRWVIHSANGRVRCSLYESDLPPRRPSSGKPRQPIETREDLTDRRKKKTDRNWLFIGVSRGSRFDGERSVVLVYVPRTTRKRLCL